MAHFDRVQLAFSLATAQTARMPQRIQSIHLMVSQVMLTTAHGYVTPDTRETLQLSSEQWSRSVPSAGSLSACLANI